jgi:tripeptide aminopeptidase
MSAEANRRIAELAGERAVHKAFAWLHLHEPQLRRWQLEFLAIPAPPFGEQARAAWFLDRFRELGLANAHIDSAGNALAQLPASKDCHPERSAQRAVEGPASRPERHNTPLLLLSAHLDTVFPASTDCTPREAGALIHAPGACDNGAGLTALLAIAAAMRHAEIAPQATVLFAANVGEEGAGDLRGMRHLFSGDSPYFQRIRASIALEGSGTATVVDRALGSRRLRVTVRGQGGHSWADSGRANPILGLSAALVALGKLKLPANPRTTLNVGTIEGGTSVNSIPESASADLDLRSTSALELDRTELAVLNTLESQLKPLEYELTMNVSRIGDRPSGALSTTSAMAQNLRAIDRHLNLRTDFRVGSTDANLPLSLNLAALAIGCGGSSGGIHTVQEWFDPTGRDLALRRILLLVLAGCFSTESL